MDKKISKVFTILLAFLPFVIVAVKNLANPNFWFDESGQFWMALGLNHYSPSFSQRSGLVDVIINNMGYNLDPGGFTVILHYWTLISSSPVWLRTLPFLFFLVSAVFLWRIACRFTSNSCLALGVAVLALFCVDNRYVHYAFELRAYSMNYCGVIVSVFLLMRYFENQNRLNMFLFNLAMSFFIFSRYSFIITAFSLSVVVLIYNRKDIAHFIKKYIFSYIPLVISVPIVVFMGLKMNSGIAPSYVSDLLLSGKDWHEIIRIVSSVLLSPYLGVVLCLAVLWGVLRIKNNAFIKVEALLIAIAIEHCVFFALSMSGRHSWGYASRWDFDLRTLSLISAVIVGAYLVNHHIQLPKKYVAQGVSPNLPIWINRLFLWTGKYAFFVCTILIISYACYLPLTGKKSFGPGDYLYTILKDNNLAFDGKRVFVPYYSQPTVRYIFEYTDFKNQLDNYKSFVFESNDEFISKNKIFCDKFDYIFFSHATVDQYEERLVGEYTLINSPLNGAKTGVLRCNH